ncbi:MAG: hypothetical protein ACFB9N_11245 [Geitlerinemataceae cyanobacterium]
MGQIERYFAFAAIALMAAVAANRAIGQQIGDRVGDTCRTVSLDERTELYLYVRPILGDARPDAPADGDSSSSTSRIVQLFDGERIAAIDLNRDGVDGDPHRWHEIEDSIGNRGYMLAIDPATGLSALRNCQ